MPNKWTRERIIHDILDCEAQGTPLTVGKSGVNQALYQAGIRLFGSWRNVLQAAGIPPERGNCGQKWPPARILTIIRNLARRRHPLNKTELEHRYGSMMSAARRLFGSWSKAVLAAGVDPVKLQRVVPWTGQRVIEAILTRALRNESLAARSTQPRSLVEAGQRFFGSWAAAVEAAGLDPKAIACRPTAAPNQTDAATGGIGLELVHRPRQPWTKEMVVAAIQCRLRQQKQMNAEAMAREDRALYRAATRRFSNWSDALRAAGLDPSDHQRGPGRKGGAPASSPRSEPNRKSQTCDELRPTQPT
jgi:hypothetical protein